MVSHNLNQERALRALHMRRQGALLIDIGKSFGVSKERARQLTQLGLRIELERGSIDPWYELNVRIRNALEENTCPPTPEGVADHFKSLAQLKRVPSIGKKCIAELQDWLIRHGERPIPNDNR
jgi:hypothetical protein